MDLRRELSSPNSAFKVELNQIKRNMLKSTQAYVKSLLALQRNHYNWSVRRLTLYFRDWPLTCKKQPRLSLKKHIKIMR